MTTIFSGYYNFQTKYCIGKKWWKFG